MITVRNAWLIISDLLPYNRITYNRTKCTLLLVAQQAFAMAFNWRQFEAWRGHPMLTNNLRHGLPGLGIGSAAFAVYVLYDKTLGSAGKSEEHH